MGAFEYFQLAEALGAEPLWVINNGISHTYSVPAENIWPLVQVPPLTPQSPQPPSNSYSRISCTHVCYCGYAF